MSKVLMVCPFSKKTIAIFHNQKIGQISKEKNMQIVNGRTYRLPNGGKSLMCTCNAEHPRTYRPIWRAI